MYLSSFCKVFILTIIAVSICRAHVHDAKCGHAYFNITVGFIDVDEAPLPGQDQGGRRLATLNTTTTASTGNTTTKPVNTTTPTNTTNPTNTTSTTNTTTTTNTTNPTNTTNTTKPATAANSTNSTSSTNTTTATSTANTTNTTNPTNTTSTTNTTRPANITNSTNSTSSANTTTATNTTKPANITNTTNPTNTTSTPSSSSPFPNIRITADYSCLTSGTPQFINYVKTSLLPPIISYFQAALRVKQPLTSPLSLPKYITQICGFNTPQALFNGVTTDFYLIVSSQIDSNNWVASAGSCFLSSTNNRPLIARMLFNLNYTQPADGNVLLHEQNMYLTMHEMIHAFGFSQASFPYFIDASGNTRTNIVKNVTLNGSVRQVLDVEPLTTNLRNFYGCSNLPGAFLENDGGAGTAGSHFERRHFLYEVMTSGVINSYRVSNFSFNVLEGSGWYVPNYTYAEPFYFGQGEGCDFINDACSQAIYNFDEFCSVAGRGCTQAGRGGGNCASDSRSDGCYYVFPTFDYDCDTADALANARLPALETYGRGLNSKCFTGNLTTATRASQTSFCFKHICLGSGLSTVVQISVGNNNVTCKAQGPATVKGYNGVINCPDPLVFCSTVGKQFCPRNCLGRGDCVDYKCVCYDGFTGVDCGLAKS